MATRKSAAMPTMNDEQDWRAREDMHSLKRAAEIQSDPKRHAAAKAHAAREADSYAKVAQSKPAAKAPAKRGAR